MQREKSIQRRLIPTIMLLLIMLAGLGNGAVTASSRESGVYLTANGISIQAGEPLRILQFNQPNISSADTSRVSQQFSAVYMRQQPQPDTYLGLPRYTMPNSNTLALLEQYGASGGFYAYQATEAFSETLRGEVDTFAAQRLACQFLFDRGFMDGQGRLLIDRQIPQDVTTPDHQSCDFNDTLYATTPIIAATQSAPVGLTQVQTDTIGIVVQVPISLTTEILNRNDGIPLGGPGGHLSLLFRTTNSDDQGFSLDSSVPGLAAAALPFYGRTLNREFQRTAPAVDPAVVQQQVEQQVRASYPNAEDVTVPNPALLYYVSDAAVEQRILEPVLNFEGIEVKLPGVPEPLVLKNITVPAVEAGENGFGPSVAITSPANGSIFAPDRDITLTGSIINGTAPYSYTWSLDDGTQLDTGQTVGTSVSLTTNQLPVVSRDGGLIPTVVHLSVQDSDGAVREAMVSLQVAPPVFLPLIIRGTPQRNSMVSQTRAQPDAPISLAATNYSFGVEAGADYPPYGPGGSDLPGVPPDAGGFRSSMQSFGWTKTFYWSNALAWEKDWRDISLGGGDSVYGVDRTDFAYWAGHGSNGGISLPSSVDSSWFPAESARFQRARWVAFSSCLTLRAQGSSPTPITRWFNSFRGSHMLMGFNGLMADVAFGPRLVDNMRPVTFFGITLYQRTIREAWVLTAFQMNAGKPAYIYAVGTNGVNPVNNKLPKPNDALLPRPFPVASYHWVWWND